MLHFPHEWEAHPSHQKAHANTPGEGCGQKACWPWTEDIWRYLQIQHTYQYDMYIIYLYIYMSIVSHTLEMFRKSLPVCNDCNIKFQVHNLLKKKKHLPTASNIKHNVGCPGMSWHSFGESLKSISCMRWYLPTGSNWMRWVFVLHSVHSLCISDFSVSTKYGFLNTLPKDFYGIPI